MLRLISGEGLGMQQLTRNMSLQVTKTSVGARRGNWPLMDLYKTYDVSHVLIIIITEGGHICLPLINNNLNTQKPQWTLSNFLCFQPELREKCVERAAFVGFPEVLAGTCKRATRFLFRRTAAQLSLTAANTNVHNGGDLCGGLLCCCRGSPPKQHLYISLNIHMNKAGTSSV